MAKKTRKTEPVAKKETVEEQTPELQMPPEPTPQGIIEVDGKRYRPLVKAFRIDGIRYESVDLELDDAMAQRILAIPGQGILKQIF